MNIPAIVAGLLVLVSSAARTQTCDCSVADVLNDRVPSCDRTIGDVVTVASAGEFRAAIDRANRDDGGLTILIANGTYRVASSASFPYLTASNVVIRSLSGERDSVVLEGEGMRDVAPATEDCLLIAGNDVVVADLTIRSVGNHGIQVSGHRLFVHNVRIQNTYQQMLKGATDRASIDSGIVQCSLFEFTAGTAANYYTGGIDVHRGRGWSVRDNVFRGIRSPATNVAEHAVHFWNNSENNTVERNVIRNCDRGIGFGLGASANRGGVIRNNFIASDGAAPFADVGIALESSPETRVYNNTILIDYANAIEYRFAATANVEIVNNLTNRSIRSRDGATATLAANVTDAVASWFVDPAAGDLHLASSVESVVDRGVALADPVSDDIDRTPRPRGAAYDIGADEYAAPSSVENRTRSDEIVIFGSAVAGSITCVADADDLTLELFDMLGRRVRSTHLLGGRTLVTLDERAGGAYVAVVQRGGAILKRQIVQVLPR